jgi:hypothetical protein
MCEPLLELVSPCKVVVSRKFFSITDSVTVRRTELVFCLVFVWSKCNVVF